MQLGWSNLRLVLWSMVALVVCHRLCAAVPYRGRLDEPKCTDEQTGRELFIGEAFTRPGLCVRVQCLGDLQLWEDSCRVPELPGNCTRIPADNEYLDHPRCCPMFECKTFRSNAARRTEETRVYDHHGALRKTDIRQVFVISSTQNGTLPGSGLRTQIEINVSIL